MRRFTVLIAALAAMLVVLAGCGSSETNDYRGDVKEVQEKYFPDLQKYSTDATSNMNTDPAAASAALDQLSATAKKMSDEIKAIDAPDDKQQLADQLVGAYSTLSSAATDLKTALASDPPDLEAVNAAIEGFNKASQDESTAVNAFNDAE
jgi:hypothetical protein